jgi:hypothetical protein
MDFESLRTGRGLVVTIPRDHVVQQRNTLSREYVVHRALTKNGIDGFGIDYIGNVRAGES